MAFFNPAGIDQLYSGETISRPSAALDRVVQRIGILGEAGRLLVVEIVDRNLRERRPLLDGHALGGKPDRGVHQLPVKGALTQRAAKCHNISH